jgi:hypothetical protein
MKKVYFLLILSFLSFTNFAATWYANGGDATDLTVWFPDVTYTGPHPANFSSITDTFVINNNMTTSGNWVVAGYLVVNNGTFILGSNLSVGTLGSGGDMIMNGSSVIDASASIDLTVTLMGNLYVNGASNWYNGPAYTHIDFANVLAIAPQLISWTTTTASTYVGIIVDAGVTVQLLTDVTLPSSNDMSETINGTLIAGSYFLNVNSNSFQMNSGAKLYTKNAGGVDSTIKGVNSYDISRHSNFVFNGIYPQVTGVYMPSTFDSGGSVTVNNPAGVSLSMSTIFNNGSLLSLLSGNIIIGSYYVAMNESATLSGTFSDSSKVVAIGPGQLSKVMQVDGSFSFPVGDTTHYTPITLNMTAGSYSIGASAGVNVVNMKHPANANINNYLNRYWTITLNRMTAPSYTAAATYAPSDVTGVEANISAGEYTALPWLKYGATNVATHTLTTFPIIDTNADISGISTAGPAITTTADTAICTGASVPLNVLTAMSDGPFTFTWSPADGLTTTVGSSVVASPTVATTYTVTATDANGFTTTSMTTVSVNQFPAVDTVIGSNSYCAGGTGVHIGLNTSDTGVNYQLYYLGLPLGSPVAGTDTTLDFGAQTADGIYSVIATGAHTGCTTLQFGSASVTVIPVVVPTVSLSSSMGDTLCAGTMTTINAAYSNGGLTPAFHWMKNGSNVGTDSVNYSNIPANGDVFVVKLISNAICAIPDSVTDTFVIAVLPNGTPALSITATPASTVCLATPVTLNAVPAFGGHNPTYIWVVNTLNVSTASSYSYVPSNGDHIFAIMNSDYRCMVGTPTAYSNVVDLTVVTPAIPSVTIAAYPGTYIGTATRDSLVATVSNGGTAPAYQWYVNNIMVPGATSATFVRSSFGNNDTASVIVTRNDACALSTINSIVISVHRVGIQEMIFNGAEITLAPNPNNGIFTIMGSLGTTSDVEAAMEITNMLGQVVYANKVIAPNGQINEQITTANGLAAGIYILNLHTANGNGTFRFVIAK